MKKDILKVLKNRPMRSCYIVLRFTYIVDSYDGGILTGNL